MAQHHFILMYDDETKQWEHDVDSEEIRFSEGTIYYANQDDVWGWAYLGDGDYHPLEEGLNDALGEAIRDLNTKVIQERGDK
jgi:hypothetical protein